MICESSALFSSAKDEWETPQDLFDKLNRAFGFTLDACALPHNAKCARYYTPEQDGLSQPWEGIVWCNPPYGRRVGDWVRKAEESARGGQPSLCFSLRGRLHFGGSKNGAPFPSMIVVFRPEVPYDL